MRSSKPIIGLCGGIAAGKSRVAEEFERAGCLVVSSDRLNHEVLADPAVAARLREWWGADIAGPDGGVDRRALAARIFADAKEKERLESLVHPLIAQRRAAMISAVEKNPAVYAIIIDSPLLLESKLDRECDVIVYVDAERRERLRRVQQDRGWSVSEFERRERWQLTDDVKRARADYVIENNGSPEQLAARVREVLTRVLARHPRPA